MANEYTFVVLADPARESMLKHAQLSPKLEVCGLLSGTGNQISSYYPVINISETPQRSFLMCPQGFLDALHTMANRKQEIVGIFHSHPDSPPQPSARDLELAAYPDVFNFIASLQNKDIKLKSFRYNGKKFSKIPIRTSAHM